MFGDNPIRLIKQSINRRAGNAGYGSEEKRPDIADIQARSRQCTADRAVSEFLCRPDPVIVRLAPASQLRVSLYRERKKAAIHSHVFVQTAQDLRFLQAVAPILL